MCVTRPDDRGVPLKCNELNMHENCYDQAMISDFAISLTVNKLYVSLQPISGANCLETGMALNKDWVPPMECVWFISSAHTSLLKGFIKEIIVIQECLCAKKNYTNYHVFNSMKIQILWD